MGDIHGCDDRLAALHALIHDDLAARPAAKTALVHLGDYVDRGPDSRGVLARIADPRIAGVSVINLRGNHEAMMLAALDGTARAVDDWLRNGGDATLESFGLSPDADPASWPAAVGDAVIARLAALPMTWAAGSYVFVHAGLRPGVPVAAQADHDLLWIRDPFLDHAGDFGAVVVHGHTPCREPEVRPNRIGIDTGAVMGGALTCVVLEGDTLGFLQA
ncbi:metallophosphoesterase family protein [Acidisphaera rubrifaciens]|uniref:Serine/threonine protein phosphatase n=1 Tax=Acidisphaera rubrifaciens HS-AP3 TaxID=1231350 RepID=A0A0D6P9M4_9PROT|nr:metallophosphoesterase family protein [Acidisphaera rubrifaciens]GAN78061.1 serine/threonine protein phosphatase [Acidisphaera rubrifaciens HS-AP3]